MAARGILTRRGQDSPIDDVIGGDDRSEKEAELEGDFWGIPTKEN